MVNKLKCRACQDDTTLEVYDACDGYCIECHLEITEGRIPIVTNGPAGYVYTNEEKCLPPISENVWELWIP